MQRGKRGALMSTGNTSDSKGESWLAEALFDVQDATSRKTDLDARVVQGEVLDRIATLNDLQRLSLVEVLATRGRESFLQAGEDVTGKEITPGLAYLFSAAVRNLVAEVIQATSGSEPVCQYCVQPVDPESEDACKQATLWVSGKKSQNTRLRRYTGAWAHKTCVEERAEKPDVAQAELEF